MLTAKKARAEKFKERFRQVYIDKKFTPVEKAFPLTDSARWDAIAPEKQREITKALSEEKNVENPHIVRAVFIGPANSGKSALFNSCIPANVSPLSTKRNTTIEWVKGVTNVHNTQLILLDTPPVIDFLDPGEYKWNSSAQTAWDALQGADVCVAVFPGVEMVLPKIRSFLSTITKRCAQYDLPCVLVISKVDKVTRKAFRKENHFHLRNALELWKLPFDAILEVSARNFIGIVDLKDTIARYAKPAQWEHHLGECTALSNPQQVTYLLRGAMLRVLEYPVVEQLQIKLLSWDEKYQNKARDDLPMVHCVVEVYHTHKWAQAQFTGKIEKIAHEAEAAILERFKQKIRFSFYNFIQIVKA